jgi:hypothetical protein
VADDVTVIDLREARTTGATTFRLPGSPSARGSIVAMEKIAPAGDVVLTSEDGVLASLAVTEARELTKRPGAVAQRW